MRFKPEIETRLNRGNSAEFLKIVRDGHSIGIAAALARGLDLNAIDATTGETALHITIKKNDLVKTKYLIERGIDLAVKDGTGQSALALATELNLQRVIKEIVVAKNVSAFGTTNNVGENPINIAYRVNQRKVAMYLIESGENVDQAMRMAIQAKDWDQVRWLCDHQGNPNVLDNQGLSPLVRAIESNSVDEVQRWIKLGADINFGKGNGLLLRRSGWSPLMVAIDLNRKEIAQLLLAQPTVRLDVAAENGMDISTFAVSKGMVEIYRELLSRGHAPSGTTREGRTLLMYACQSGSLEMVSEVFEISTNNSPQFNVNAQDQLGWTPLMFATNAGAVEVVKYLLRSGVDKTLKSLDHNFTAERIAIVQRSKLSAAMTNEMQRFDQILSALRSNELADARPQALNS